MSFLKTNVHANVPSIPFLRATTGGLDLDGNGLFDSLIITITEARDVRKLFADGQLISTCFDCAKEPNCAACKDPKARGYLRLTLKVGEEAYLMDLPPKSAAKLVALDLLLTEEGGGLNEVPLRLTTIAKSANGMSWAEAVFGVAGDGETSSDVKAPEVF